MNRTLQQEQKNALNEALTMAVAAKDLEMMGLALDNGADAQPLLFTGIDKREKDWVQLALDKGADPDATKRGWLSNTDRAVTCPAIFWLCDNFNADVGDVLIKKGAKIDARSDDNQTALHWASGRCNRVTIEWFVANGADPLATGGNGKTPMQMLANNSKLSQMDKTDLTKLMLKAMSGQQAGAAATPAGTFNQVATKEAIEVSKPIELKKKPDGGGLNL